MAESRAEGDTPREGKGHGKERLAEHRLTPAAGTDSTDAQIREPA